MARRIDEVAVEYDAIKGRLGACASDPMYLLAPPRSREGTAGPGALSLAQAIALFEGLGAPLWAERARRELRPVGGRPTSRVALTPAEQRVAELAASGMTNR